ncbi:23S rRNA (adenine(1618)-N(6))-methyltransferase RlmF [Luteimonas sp. XNQY3]|nr:23S rRNA (adenine(1618)-N(6))-methyltransferase RlmF [Luteimonas sp. XNQY3]MCD9006924.1 23S rRNA (adenine(1618)-N(6))-methyltransferase RlmF [Luteimonas sp. XNQY3]
MSSHETPARPAQTLHPRNRHQGRYDFVRLTRASSALKPFLVRVPEGGTTIDFTDPRAVRALNQALLKADYGIAHWDVPDGYLCPPIPGRADYIHGLADLLAADRDGDIPRGASVRAFDVGTGANVVYPLLGHTEYGWRFTGSDVDAKALAGADAIVRSNGLMQAITLRQQRVRGQLFRGLVGADDRFDVTLCNPPFHASAAEAARGNQRKRGNLGARKPAPARAERPPRLNFGGQDSELWCPGGEARFVSRMIAESAGIGRQVLWFTSLVSKSAHLPRLRYELRKAEAVDMREIAMAQGSKQSRFLAWTFHTPDARRAWWTRGADSRKPTTRHGKA